ncbi:Na(+)/H(+) exchanger beta-like [Acanthaster planci]|uniref:Sodium/hydrogen exchanger n=1 Tax=Acanthaster planci TaxID=133434 RepID=A0A8B7YC79_ACAPL|nr:Na(+)/H(+) exchanger beta-like [Acanthaster planci]
MAKHAYPHLVLRAVGTLVLLYCPGNVSAAHDNENFTVCHASRKIDHFEVVHLDWQEVQVPFGICLWIMVASLATLCFHNTFLPKVLPESCLLLITGFVVGGVIKINPEAFPHSLSYGLNTDLFFLFLLPPIILEASYFLPMRSFFNNIGTILLYAVIGTVFNTVAIGLSLYGISQLGWYGTGPNGTTIYLSALECLTFGSLISAVDPVAVLAVFEEVQVNEILFILVFGESLLNDAVTVVLYRIFESFNAIGADRIQVIDIVSGFFSFFVVSIGGLVVGLLYGFLTSLLTRLTHKARVIEPIFVFVMAYMAYLTAEMFHLSSILAIVSCAIFMKPYVESNISRKSRTTIKYSLKMLSSISETIIFIFLGVTTLVDLHYHQWNTAFVIYSLVFCLLYRVMGVFVQTRIANSFRLAKISSTEQFIMAYGGLRGAIAYSLVSLLCNETVHSKKMMYTSCIVVVMFTVFIQGTTIKPIVGRLRVKKATKSKPTMNEKIFERLVDHVMVGMEDILAQHGHHSLRNKWEKFNKNFAKPLLMQGKVSQGDPKILEVFSKLNERDAMERIRSTGSLFHRSSVGMQHQSSDGFSIGSRTPSVIGGLSLNGREQGIYMHPMSSSVSKRFSRDSISGQLNLLADNMYKPQRLEHHFVSSRLTDIDDYQEPRSLMRRSLNIQLRHRCRRRKQRRRLRRSSLMGSTTYDDISGSNDEILSNPSSKEHIQSRNGLREDEDEEGITFVATASSDELDSVKETVEKIPVASQKISPWRATDRSFISVRAEMHPLKHFEDTSAQTPNRMSRVKPKRSSVERKNDDSVPLTSAMELP